MDVGQFGERLDGVDALDRVAAPLHAAATKVLRRGPIKDLLHGVWLGHPLHPSLTDLPIGCWTSAFLLDVLGGRRARPAATTLIGCGVVSALPTAAAGIADWTELEQRERRTGVVHAVANLTATALYGLSYLARRRGRHTAGVVLGLVGVAAASGGGYLGGHLSFRRASGVNHATGAPAGTEWAEVSLDGELTGDAPNLVHLEGAPLVAVGGDRPAALFDTCSHLGGPLHEGELTDGCVRCPWHASTFRMADGGVVRGPATAPQPAYELRTASGMRQARRRRTR
jgi:nitrite reductase/ring-hydroxylating ferredoxin subunit/uncharacterized membrane protein